MNTVIKALVGTAAAGAMAVTAVSPAMARDRDRHGDGIDAGDIIAGALIIGGIAAVASAASKDRGYNGGGYYDGGYDRDYYRSSRYDRGYGDNPRQAVEQCVNAVSRDANRYSRGRARVTDIRDVDRKRGGFRVKGTLVVNERNRGWNRDYGYSRGGYDYDSGRFTCDIRYGRVVNIDYSGIRGLR
ncbi:MAG: hypothetical protein IE933_13840 [Sphingomonadales bacterium]|nr:hypothetical protein [Sphingomonadales bacterium]MBD3773841.1 hypothetical protein [Paracoccaceae bacterium]